jgi:TonB family protein
VLSNSQAPMRRLTAITFAVLCAMAVFVNLPGHAQQDQPESRRKMVTRVVAVYPNLAHDMRIAGTVKIEAVVAPNGTVKSAAILGGHPVLAQAGVDAVRRCKWEAASHETKELVVLNFHPE